MTQIPPAAVRFNVTLGTLKAGLYELNNIKVNCILTDVQMSNLERTIEDFEQEIAVVESYITEGMI